MARMNTLTFAEMLERQKQQKPRRHPAEEEHHLQAACVRWFRLQHPDLANALFAVPNGGRRDKVTAAKLRDEGVLPGVADLILLQRTEHYGALLIEMKTPTGRQSQEQREWQKWIEPEGYRYVICRSLDEFIASVENYLSLL